MWFITAIVAKQDCQENPTLLLHRKRTFGFYTYLSDVEEAVNENRCDLHECLYTYLVCEDIPHCGIHPEVEREIWYEWKMWKPSPNMDAVGHWVKCEKPEDFAGIVNWALG